MNRAYNYRGLIIGILTLLIAASCSISAKEEYLGNNLYLSEYDCVDRRILFQKEKQAISGEEIIPMTVSEFANNKNWIISKSDDSKDKEAKYWIILNKYHKTPTPTEVKENTIGPLSKIEFEDFLRTNEIELVLKMIKC